MWFALYVQNERKSSEALIEAGFDCYLPTIARYTKLRHATKDQPFTRKDEPIFPRYIFAQADDETFGAMLRASEAIYALGSCGVARPIPDEVIAAVRYTVSTGVFDEVEPVVPEKRKRIRYKGMQALRMWLDANRPQPLAKTAA